MGTHAPTRPSRGVQTPSGSNNPGWAPMHPPGRPMGCKPCPGPVPQGGHPCTHPRSLGVQTLSGWGPVHPPCCSAGCKPCPGPARWGNNHWGALWGAKPGGVPHPRGQTPTCTPCRPSGVKPVPGTPQCSARRDPQIFLACLCWSHFVSELTSPPQYCMPGGGGAVFLLFLSGDHNPF